MRGLSDLEREEMLALDAPGERVFDASIFDTLLACRRIEEWDIAPDGAYRVRVTALGRIALNMWPLTRMC